MSRTSGGTSNPPEPNTGGEQGTVSQPHKKRGNPGKFTSQRLAFLIENEPRYRDTLLRSEPHSLFWDDLMAEYWLKFPWNVPLTQDPPDLLPDAPTELTAAEQAEKTKVVTELTKVSIFSSFLRRICLHNIEHQDVVQESQEQDSQ